MTCLTVLVMNLNIPKCDLGLNIFAQFLLCKSYLQFFINYFCYFFIQVRRASGVGHDVPANIRQDATRLYYHLHRTVGVRFGVSDQQQLAFVQGRVGGRPERPDLLIG